MVGGGAGDRACDEAAAPHVLEEDYSWQEYVDVHCSKEPQKSWIEHYLYFLSVSEACGGAGNLVLD